MTTQEVNITQEESPLLGHAIAAWYTYWTAGSDMTTKMRAAYQFDAIVDAERSRLRVNGWQAPINAFVQRAMQVAENAATATGK